MKTRTPRRQAPAVLPPAPPRRLFRVAAAVLVPLLALALAEAILRAAGYGYPTTLFERVRLHGTEYLVNNEKFALRFFPPELARWPSPLLLEPAKPANTVRIFIFGESAAQGDPEPAFGAGRYLEFLLREKYPGVNFEVINVAITAINSNVILPIARECARYQGDLWIVYMGNNEMIGPFGAATVFGVKGLPWPVIRLQLALQNTRLGQLLAQVGRKLRRHKDGPAVWGGLQMFLGNELAPGDPKKEVVYKNFRRNLQDIIDAGRQAGASVILNTVSVNLKDCPPFASKSAANLPVADRDSLERLRQTADRFENSGDWAAAAGAYAEATRLDPTQAELLYRCGVCALQLHDAAGAGEWFQKACDCDALPVRADSRINGIIREAAQRPAGGPVDFCDTAASLAADGAPPGNEIFYEHVHFNFDGNYRLARLWAEHAAGLLPADARKTTRDGWLSQENCEARLGLTDWNRVDVYHAVRQRMDRPPLNLQFNNPRREAQISGRIDQLLKARTPSAAEAARALYARAIAQTPGDYVLHQNYGEFLELTGDFKTAAAEWKEAGSLMPRNPFAFLTEGQLLEKLGDPGGARQSLLQAVALHPRYAEAWFELGKVDAAEGKYAAAAENYQKSIELQPYDSQTFLYLGKALSLLKRSDESLAAFRHALELDPANWEAHYALGGELGTHGRFGEAKAEFEAVVRAQPEFAMGHLNLGVALLKLQDGEGARREFGRALQLDPGNAAARSYLGALSK